MVTAALLLAGALAVSSPRPAARVGGGTSRSGVPPAAIPAVVVGAALTALSLDRAGIVIAGCLVAATAAYSVLARRRARLATESSRAAAEFISHLAEALGAGAPPAEAARRAAQAVPEDAPEALRRDIIQFCGAAHRGANPPELDNPELNRVSSLWEISARRGVPIAGLLDLAREEIDHTLRHKAATNAALAGPRTTAAVLAALPLAGVAMGAAMGAHPVRLLLSPGLGAVLLCTGTALACGGVLVAGAIIRRAAA